MGATGRRVRSLLDGNVWVVAGLLIALAAGGGYLTYETYAEPGVHLEQRPGTSAQYAGNFSHGATVRVENPVFDEGRTLANRQAYYTRLTPVLNGTFRYTYAASDGGSVDANARLELRIRSVETGDGDEQTIEYWSVTRQLDAASADGLAPGEELGLAFSENVTRLFNETRRIDERVGGTPGEKRLRVVAIVETEGEVNDRSVERTREYSLGLVEDDSIYRVNDPGTVVNGTNTTRTVRVPNTYGPLRRAGAPLLLVLGLVGLAGLAGARHENLIALSERERAYLDYERVRNEFDDWITTARLGPDGFDGDVVEVETLDGLVDVAIDSDRRVLQDAASGEYRCKVDDVVYRYTPPREPDDGPWPPAILGGADAGDAAAAGEESGGGDGD